MYRRKHDRLLPRSWWSLFLAYGGWAALIFGAILVLLTFVSATQLAIADRLDVDGRFTSATVLSKRIVESTDSDGDTTYDYYVTFRFKTAQGGHEIQNSVSRSYYFGVAEGEPVTIRYLRSDPTIMEHEIGSYRSGGIVARWIGLIMGVLGLLVLYFGGNRAARAILTRRYGEKRMATVMGIRELNVKTNNRRQARLQWREEDGQTGESYMRRLSDLSGLYRAGDQVVVFRRGKHVYWEGDVGPPKREMTDT